MHTQEERLSEITDDVAILLTTRCKDGVEIINVLTSAITAFCVQIGIERNVLDKYVDGHWKISVEYQEHQRHHNAESTR